MDPHQERAKEAVREMMRITGLDATGLARKAGIAPSTLTRLMAGAVKHTLSARTLARLAEAAGVPMPLPAEGGSGGRTQGGVAPPTLELPAPATLPRDMPVYGSAEGGPDGIFELQDGSGLPIDPVRRPPGLAGMRTAFALYTAGDSMSPWREPGGLIFVHPDRPPAPGSYVVVVFKPSGPGEPRRAMVKKLVRRSPSKFVFEQFNPPKQLEFDAAEIERLWRVIDWEEALGFA